MYYIRCQGWVPFTNNDYQFMLAIRHSLPTLSLTFASLVKEMEFSLLTDNQSRTLRVPAYPYAAILLHD